MVPTIGPRGCCDAPAGGAGAAPAPDVPGNNESRITTSATTPTTGTEARVHRRLPPISHPRDHANGTCFARPAVGATPAPPTTRLRTDPDDRASLLSGG